MKLLPYLFSFYRGCFCIFNITYSIKLFHTLFSCSILLNLLIIQSPNSSSSNFETNIFFYQGHFFWVVYSTTPLMFIFLLPSIFCSICDPTTSRCASLNNWNYWNSYFIMKVRATPIAVDFMKSKEYFDSIVGF